jgi:hypothetical protein
MPGGTLVRFIAFLLWHNGTNLYNNQNLKNITILKSRKIKREQITPLPSINPNHTKKLFHLGGSLLDFF